MGKVVIWANFWERKKQRLGEKSTEKQSDVAAPKYGQVKDH